MKYCINKNRSSALCLLAFLCIVAGVLISLLGASHSSRITKIVVAVMLMVSITPLIYVSAGYVYILHRKYRLDKDYVEIVDMFGRRSVYGWSEISDIGICKVHYSSRPPYLYDVVIRCVVGNESNGPKQGYFGSWASEFYEILHHRKIIAISFSEERLTEFRAVSPNPIADYRFIKKNNQEQ